MTEILFLTTINKRELSHVLPIKTITLIRQHRILGYNLSSCRPTTREEREQFNADLDKFKSVKHELKSTGYKEFILRFQVYDPEAHKKKQAYKPRTPQKYHHWQPEFKKSEPIKPISQEKRRLIQILISENQRLIAQLNTFNPNDPLAVEFALLHYKRYLSVQKDLKSLDPNGKVEEWYTGVSYKVALDPSIIPIRRARVMVALGDFCNVCGSKENLEIHHRKWQCHGGKDEISNLQVLCHGCHCEVHGFEAGITMSKDIQAEMAMEA
jgi:hypothetical protein